ncbi:amidohydrolase family protein [Nocardioides acrostichi]|uniref:Amidohydrolase family protein n=1 Tax=Nocardioides acrostichi TaxID=2784339 RepID=A0A930V0W8_9ACTN|nr:amidohydrolase family protein [Nocardioides acrostichi]MBF4163347.1 amidohydrolase family protein [Nocardioides acrostichi]
MPRTAPRVIDSHVHFWDPASRRHPWLDEVPALFRPMLPGQYQQQAPRSDGLVFVEADCEESAATGEVAWIESLAASGVPVLGIVAAVRLESPDVEESLAALARRPLVVGVRRLLQDERAGFCLDTGLLRGVRAAGDHGLAVDLCVRSHQLVELVELARLCPSTTLVLDHCGKPRIGSGDLDRWTGDLERLAAHEHVVCKLSGLATEASGGAEPLIAEYLRRALDVFGPDRVLFGSDWPVCTLETTWFTWHATVTRVVQELSPAEQAAVMGGNAERFYRLGDVRGEAS